MTRLPEILPEGAEGAFARWREAIEGALGLRGDRNTVLTKKGPLGTVLRLNDKGEKRFLLSGAGNPYSGQEVKPAASGAWSTSPGGLSVANLYERNGLTGLSGKVVKAVPTMEGDWRFTFLRHGSPPPPACQLCVTVPECLGHPAAVGSVVTVQHATTVVGTCTTNSVGSCCVPLPGSNSYVLNATVPAYLSRYYTAPTPLTRTVTCPGATNVSLPLTLKPAWACTSCFPSGFMPTAAPTFTDSVYGTAASGAVYTGGTGLLIKPAAYTGCSGASLNGYAGCNPGGSCLARPIEIDYFPSCDGSGVWSLIVQYYYDNLDNCHCPTNPSLLPSGRVGVIDLGPFPATSVSENPWVITFGGGGGSNSLYCGGGPVFTMTWPTPP